jgi:methylated-DNA-[protein]-cysteine S-methyltransferase
MDLRYDLFSDALGFALAVVRGGRLISLGHSPSPEDAELRVQKEWPGAVYDPEAPPLPEVRRQLHQYLSGERRDFDLPLEVSGTEFQRRCWEALQAIPYGETRTYGEQARLIGHPAAVRAVGRANHDNPLGVVIPCHRVIGANGSLTGYAGGLSMKQFLLELEGVLPRRLEGM